MIPIPPATESDPATSARDPLRSPACPMAHEMTRIDLRPVLRVLQNPANLRIGEDLLEVEFTRMPSGRRRPWARCAGCGRRCAVVYALRSAPARFRCGRCWTVRYASDRWSPATRRRMQAIRIRRMLGEHVDPDDVGGFRSSTPPRPRYMRKLTYARLLRQLADLEDNDGMAPRSGRPKGMTGRKYQATLARMSRSSDGGAVEAAVMNLSRVALALRRGGF